MSVTGEERAAVQALPPMTDQQVADVCDVIASRRWQQLPTSPALRDSWTPRDSSIREAKRMALITTRVCDKTGDHGAEQVMFSVGDKQWTIDLSDAARKELEDVLEPWIALAQAAGSDTAVAVTVPDPADDPDDALTAEERAICRAWAQQNEKRLNLPATSDRGGLRQAVVDAWVEQGKPAAKPAAAKRKIQARKVARS